MSKKLVAETRLCMKMFLCFALLLHSSSFNKPTPSEGIFGWIQIDDEHVTSLWERVELQEKKEGRREGKGKQGRRGIEGAMEGEGEENR